MTAEQEWQIFDAGSFDETTSQVSRESYKSALRKAIEKEISKCETSLRAIPPSWESTAILLKGRIEGLKISLHLQDTVTPE